MKFLKTITLLTFILNICICCEEKEEINNTISEIQTEHDSDTNSAQEEKQKEILSQYSIKKINNIKTPVSNPTGIATDNSNFWIMSGQHNGRIHKLTNYNPETFKIIKQFSFNNLTETLGTGVYGITWDGSNIWISVSGNTNKLAKVDISNGQIVQTWNSPSNLGPSDLEWDGEKIYISTGTGEIFTLNPLNGGSKLILDNFIDHNRDSGITIIENKLWIGDLFNKNIYVYNIEDGSYEGVIKEQLTSNGKFCFYNNQLVVIGDNRISFYEITSTNN